jgi:hypothetical protein
MVAFSSVSTLHSTSNKWPTNALESERTVHTVSQSCKPQVAVHLSPSSFNLPHLSTGSALKLALIFATTECSVLSLHVPYRGRLTRFVGNLTLTQYACACKADRPTFARQTQKCRTRYERRTIASRRQSIDLQCLIDRSQTGQCRRRTYSWEDQGTKTRCMVSRTDYNLGSSVEMSH